MVLNWDTGSGHWSYTVSYRTAREFGEVLFDLSVIVCAWNEEKYLGRCLRSLSEQAGFDNFETLIVDDASTDSTVEVAKRSDLSNLKIIQNAQNLGIGGSSNRGMREASSRYVVRVDADDFVSQFFLASLYSAITETRSHAVRCDYRVVDEKELTLAVKDSSEDPIACGVIFERDLLVDIGLYRDDLRVGEDEELEKRFLERYSIFRLPVPLYRYRKHDGNTSKTFV